MFDNQENATYSRSTDYAEFFLAEWEEAHGKSRLNMLK